MLETAMTRLPATLVLALGLAGPGSVAAGGDAAPPTPASPSPAPSPPAPAQELPGTEAAPTDTLLGHLGVTLSSADENNEMHLWFRAQIRFSSPFNLDPRNPGSFDAPTVNSLDLQRIRIKLGGHAYRPWLKYYFEYDFKSQMLDVELTLTRWPWLQLRVGQWKVTYNRERVDSSGKQQFADRSIVNREFTLDRQPGIMIGGHLAEGTPADLWYVAGLFNGNGQSAANDDSHPMWLTRLQWSPLGRQLSFSQSDIKRHPKPAGTLAFATTGNRSPYTRFATSGPGDLDGFPPGGPGQYSVQQYLEEVAFMYRGFSLQHEWHWKNVTDNDTGLLTRLQGSYVQAGFFPSEASSFFPRPLEVAVRWAFVDPDRSAPDDSRRELTLGANWFFAGHDNKLTTDVSRLELDQPAAPTLRDYRVRLQWDVSF